MSNPPLTSAQRSHLRGLAQRLDPVLKIGREGLSEPVKRELERQLHLHELVKLRFVNADRDERAQLCDAIAAAVDATCVGAVGHTASFFRRNADPADYRIDV